MAFYLGSGFDVEAVFVDYGQRPREAERKSARAIAAYYSLPLAEVTLAGPHIDLSGEIVGRNALLLLTALFYRAEWTGLISLGIHAGTPYYDCSSGFVEHISPLLDAYTSGRVAVGAPFLLWTKDMIVAFCKERNVPLTLTWSCEVGPSTPCGLCPSCRDREALHACTEF